MSDREIEDAGEMVEEYDCCEESMLPVYIEAVQYAVKTVSRQS